MSEAPSTLLRRARFARGWSQLDLARRLGISQGTVNFWEHGKNVSPAMRAKVVALLGVDPWESESEPLAAAAPSSVAGPPSAAGGGTGAARESVGSGKSPVTPGCPTSDLGWAWP